LGGDVLKRYEKDFRGDILMRKTRARAKKREREKQRGGFCFGKKQNDTRVNALLLSLRGDFWFFEEEGESKNKFFKKFFSSSRPILGLNWSRSRRLPH
jgi:hypothetical protein